MNERSVIQAPEPGGGPVLWLDQYLGEGQLQPQQRPKLIDVSAIRGILYRQRWLVLTVLVLSLIGGAIWTLLATPMYEAQATVKVDPDGMQVVEGQNLTQGLYVSEYGSYLSTQVAVIKSRNLASVVAGARKLGDRPDFLGADVDERRPPNLSDAQWASQKHQMAASQLAGGVDADVPVDDLIITIRYRSENPVLAAEMANAYVDAFVASDAVNRVDSNQYAQEYLQQQIALVRGRLEQAELAANNYARANSIVIEQQANDAAGDGVVTVTTSRLANINDRVAAARANRIATEQRWRSTQYLPATQLPEVQSNPMLQQLVTDRTTLQAELARLQQRYNEQFPQIVDVKAQIDALSRQIDRASADIKATVRNDFVVALNQEQALQRELNSVKSDTLIEQDSQVQFSVLEREAQALRDQLKVLLDRYNSISTAANVQTGNITKLDSALVPASPYSPNTMRNLAMALALGIALAGGLALLRETFDDRLRSLDEVEDKIGLTLLGHTPFVEPRDLKEEADRFSQLMEAYSSIRSAIDFTLPREQKVIQLTSSRESEGKSTTAVILAELFANLGRKTLLIDADLRRPSIAKLVNLEQPEAGLIEVVLGHTDLQSATVKGQHDNLEILPMGTISPNPIEVLASQQMYDFMEKCRDEYSIVIVDSSPVMGIADAPILASLVDATVFVLEANKVPFGLARSAIKRLRLSHGNVIGAVLTKYRALQAGQNYDYQYNYYRYGED